MVVQFIDKDCLSEPKLYGDLVHKLKMIMGRIDSSEQLEIIIRDKRVGCNYNVMSETTCLVFNPITVDNLYASLFNCTPVGRASDSMMVMT